MSKKTFALMLILLFVIAPFSSCFAVPLFYSVSGKAFVADDLDEYDVLGELYLDDSVEFEDYGYGNGSFRYSIPSFSISIGPYAFSGSGVFFSHHYADNDNAFTCPHDGSQLVGEGDWLTWNFLHYGTDFFNENGEAYDKGADDSDFLNVPYRIFSPELPACSYSSNLYFDYLEIARNEGKANTAPVPEPSTLMLFGFGTIALIAKRRKISFSKKKSPISGCDHNSFSYPGRILP